jgi:hypothetical protein
MLGLGYMRVADRRHALALLASILLLATPQLALAQGQTYTGPASMIGQLVQCQVAMPGSCSISFDQNPITEGQGTYLRWSATLGPVAWACYDSAWLVSMTISNVGTVGSWYDYEFPPHGSYYDYVSGTKSGSVWVAPGGATNYSGTLDNRVHGNYTCSGPTLYVNPAGSASPALSPAPPFPPPPPPSCSVTFDKNLVTSGGGTTIRWSSTSAQLFYINTVGYVGASGSASIAPSGTTDYSGYVNNKADGTGDTAACAATLVVSGGQCPPGQILRDGQCVAQCPIGYIQQGNQCVFSACPSGYVKQGTRCVRSNLCTTPPHCSGDDLVNSCTGALIRSCDWGCTGSACNPVPTPSATLKATPSLLHAGNTTLVSWTGTNVSSCAVSGTNGDSWTGKSSDPSNSSGQAGKTSKTIQSQTTFNLHCIGYAGSSPATIDKSVIVNIIPRFIEK